MIQLERMLARKPDCMPVSLTFPGPMVNDFRYLMLLPPAPECWDSRVGPSMSNSQACSC